MKMARTPVGYGYNFLDFLLVILNPSPFLSLNLLQFLGSFFDILIVLFPLAILVSPSQ